MVRNEAQWLWCSAFIIKYNMNVLLKKILVELVPGNPCTAPKVIKRIIFMLAFTNPWYFVRTRRAITNTTALVACITGDRKDMILVNSDISPARCVNTQRPSSPWGYVCLQENTWQSCYRYKREFLTFRFQVDSSSSWSITVLWVNLTFNIRRGN